MNQEKQKVIRVLKPTKKTKKVSPIYYGVAGAALGVAVTSVLLFSVLGKDSNIEHAQATNIQSAEQSVENTQNNTESSTHPLDALNEQASNTQENDDESAHEGFNIPQPKANEINGIFTHKKVESPKPEKQVASNDNPFGALSGQPPLDKPNVTSSKPLTASKVQVTTQKPITTSVLKAQASKSVDAATAKINQDANKIEAEKTQANTTKVQSREKEAEIETPNATVQISVTRSVKE